MSVKSARKEVKMNSLSKNSSCIIGRGAIVNCERASCKKGFHPECARRGKQYLDIRENNMGQV